MAVYALAMVGYALDSALAARPSARPALAGVAVALARPERTGRVATSLTVLAFGLHASGVVFRAAAAGRVPWGNMYEFATTGALAATAAYLFFMRRYPLRDLGAWVVGVVLLTLGLSVTVLYTPAGDLVPALDSYWLVIHVIAAIVSGGIFTVGALAAALYLLRRRSAATLERVVHVTHLFAFPLWTFAIIAGAIWAENAWGRYWGWDPKEVWSFVTWVLYAAYLHAQATAGWRGRRATWFALAGYVAFVFNFFGVNMWITGLHSYAGI
ncbi:cytochrome c biogenesis protein CcsA [Kineosporiaceae bacterium SCSIO 59966]|nr:cytochrome c biogenesis protein CcsA [Kineosporiaceae bacterium SCSIO 59966]